MIVVFGAFGRTGRIAAETVEAQGQAARWVTSQALRTREARGRDVVVARLSDESELGRALCGARAVYAILPDDFSAPAFHAQRRAMANALTRALARQKVSRVVLLSAATAALGEDAGNGLGADLAYFERLLLELGVSVTVLRASYFQDNVLAALPSAERDGIYANCFGSPGTAIHTIAARDVGTLAAQVLLEPAPPKSEIVDLLGPSYLPAQIGAELGRVLGRSLAIVDLPPGAQLEVFRRWMSAEAARAMVQTLQCLSSGAELLRGDRSLRGVTRLDQVLSDARSPRALPNQVQT